MTKQNKIQSIIFKIYEAEKKVYKVSKNVQIYSWPVWKDGENVTQSRKFILIEIWFLTVKKAARNTHTKIKRSGASVFIFEIKNVSDQDQGILSDIDTSWVVTAICLLKGR